MYNFFMEHGHISPYLQEMIIILAAAGVIVPFLHKLRISPVLGYLIAGFALGPHGLASFDVDFISKLTIKNPEDVTQLAEFGIVFLLFMIGLELSPARLWDMRRLIFGLGLLQVLITAAIIGPIAYLFGNGLVVSIILGLCFALSSTAIVMQILMDRKKMATSLGRACFSILLFQDLAAVPILIFLGVLDGGPLNGISLVVAIALAKSVAVVAAIFIGGRYLLRPLFRAAGAAPGTETFMAMTLLTIIAIATLTSVAGLSMTLGAFVAGLLLAETQYSHAIEAYINPFKGLLLGVFFMTVGMGLDFALVMENLTWLCLSVVGLVLLKTAVTVPLARLFGLSWGTSVETGLLLGQGGEFAFIIVGTAMASKLLPASTGQFMLIVASLSMAVTPAVSVLARRIRLSLEKRNSDVKVATADDIPADIEEHVIIAGVGRVGRAITRVLEAEGIPYISIDSNTAVVEEKRKKGQDIFYGDASHHELLALFKPERARAIVLTMDDAHAAVRAIENIQKYWPALPIFARSRDIRLGRRLHQAGAHKVVAETAETSLQLARHLLAGIGLDETTIAHRLEHERAVALAGIKEAPVKY
jgi:CPA2 family monovalent cation:H+ antiporter-2